ncbi:uncharacterized protein LOC116240017 [Phasianus colchicus]|uniref:uncharacterized protein LOC116240017 n=1 Tax=Phasianus colchicus TaxID=9054 RepID=UPI00129EEDE3|nr:uncharacterized protein LOC116240017 [Phasianus colchicus]
MEERGNDIADLCLLQKWHTIVAAEGQIEETTLEEQKFVVGCAKVFFQRDALPVCLVSFLSEADACGLPLKHSHVESQGRSSTAQECSTAPKRVVTSSDVPEDVTDIQGLLSWINDVARAVEVPHENPSNPAPGCFIAELRDNPRDSRELCMEAQAATGMPTNPFWGLPPSPGFLSELQSGLSQLHPVVPSASAWLSPLPTSLAVTTPSLVQTAQPIEEVQQREPQVAQAHSPLSPGSVPSRMAEKKGSTKWAKRPEPAGNTQKGESSQQE